jgi:hypothetical protein
MNEPQRKTLTNPAKRLHAILAAAGDKNYQNKEFRKYLAETLGGDATNDLDMFRNLLGIYDLVALTDRRIATMQHHKRQTYATCIRPVVTVLQHMQLNTAAHRLPEQLQSGPLHILDLASDALDQEQPEFLIEQNELDALYSDADKLEESIKSADLPLELQTLLLDSINRIKAALKNYKLSGLEGLDRAIREAYGAAFVDHSVVLPEKDNPIVRSFWDWLGKINTTVSGCKNAYAAGLIATDAVIHLLDYISR